jgi:hypothetical protein
VVAAVEETGLDSSRIAPLLKSAAAWSERLQLEQDNALSSLIDRVDLGQDGIRLSIKLPLSNAGGVGLRVHAWSRNYGPQLGLRFYAARHELVCDH